MSVNSNSKLTLSSINLRIAGVDEAGRGPLAGPVVAAAVVLDDRQPIEGLADSKKLSEAKRIQLDTLIRERALCFWVSFAEHDEIDSVNILNATMNAMSRALQSLSPAPEHVLVDGNRCPNSNFSCQAVVGGDALHECISAASILAKVARDRHMCELDLIYPEYGFARHKGYPTAYHRQALLEHGPCPIHRYSYAPVRAAVEHQRMKLL